MPRSAENSQWAEPVPSSGELVLKAPVLPPVPPRRARPRTDAALFWEVSGDLFSACDSEGRFVDVNPAWQRILGWDLRQVRGRLVMNFLHPDDLTSAVAAGTVVANEGRVHGIESRLLCADGSYRWFSWSAYTDGDGWFSVGQDITERKTIEAARELAEAQVVRSHEFNQATLDSLEAHIAVLDEAGTITFVNDAWARFASHNGSPDVGVGESYLEVCDAAEGTAPEAGAVARALRLMLEGSLDSYEVEYPCHSNDEERWFSLRAGLHRSAGPPQVVVQHHNITYRVQAERGQRIRSRMLDEVDASVIATDPEGRVTFWSGGAERLYGWTQKEALGKRVEDLTVPAHLRKHLGEFVHKLSHRKRLEGDLELCRKDGSSFMGSLRASAFSDVDGVPVGFLGISFDATERARNETEVRETRDYLEGSPAQRGRGLGGGRSFRRGALHQRHRRAAARVDMRRVARQEHARDDPLSPAGWVSLPGRRLPVDGGAFRYRN